MFTRILLALFGIMPWRARAGDAGRDHAAAALVSVPPRQDFVLGAHGDRAAAGAAGAEAARANPTRHQHRRTVPRAAAADRPLAERRRIRSGRWFQFFRGIDAVLRVRRAVLPEALRASARSTRRSHSSTERLNGEDGLGAIFPGDGQCGDDVRRARLCREIIRDARSRAQSVEKLLVDQGRRSLLPALRLAGVGHGARRHALLEVGDARSRGGAPTAALEWLKPLQVLDVDGDWATQRPNVRPGGWAFQYANAHYPDLDDTAVVVMAMDRARKLDRRRMRYDAAIDARPRMGRAACRAATAAGRAFDADNDYDISTTFRSPITARCSIRRPTDVTRALRLDARAARRTAGTAAGARARRSTICCATRWTTAAGTAAGA